MQCPSCHKDVPLNEKQFGALYTCQKCQSVYFVNFDGIPEYGEIAPIEFVSDNQSNDHVLTESDQTAVERNEQSFQPFESAFEANAETMNDTAHATAFETIEQMPEQISAEVVTDTFSDKNPFDSIAREIETFGNQETEISGLTYDLKITGLDSKESIFILKEALDDSKFGWNSEDILKQINYGHLELKQMTPVQAFILAKRIQFIDAEMNWSQNVLA